MSSIVVSGDVSGAITIAAPSAAGTNTLTLPVLTQTVNVMGPAFGAYQSVAQSALSGGVETKLSFQTEEYDTANCFDSSTNYRFTPNVAGYYQISGSVQFNGTSTGIYVVIYRNGSAFKYGTVLGVISGANTYANGSSTVSSLIYFNGTTDYVELYGYTGTSRAPFALQNVTYFNGCFLRGA